MSYPGPYASPPAQAGAARPLKGLTTALTVLLILTALASVLTAFACFNRASVIEEFLRGDLLSFISKADDADSSVRGTFGLFILLGIADLVIWIIWQVRKAGNNRLAAGVPAPPSSHALLVGRAICFGVFVVVTVAGLGSHPSRDEITGFGLSSNASKIKDYASADRITGVGLLGLSVAAILFILLARSLAARQETRLAGMSSAVGWVPAPGVAYAPIVGPPLAGAAWQPDPYGEGQLRWWDGQQWTSHVSGPKPGDAGPPPT